MSLLALQFAAYALYTVELQSKQSFTFLIFSNFNAIDARVVLLGDILYLWPDLSHRHPADAVAVVSVVVIRVQVPHVFRVGGVSLLHGVCHRS